MAITYMSENVRRQHQSMEPDTVMEPDQRRSLEDLASAMVEELARAHCVVDHVTRTKLETGTEGKDRPSGLADLLILADRMICGLNGRLTDIAQQIGQL